VVGSGLSFSWDFGDGSTANGENATHIFQRAGDYRVRVSVRNVAGEATSDMMVLVKNLTGTWDVRQCDELLPSGRFDIIQVGNTLEGTYQTTRTRDVPSAKIVESRLEGRVMNIGAVQDYGVSTLNLIFRGTLEPSADEARGILNVVDCDYIMRRR
jgi:PKD repeat protein